MKNVPVGSMGLVSLCLDLLAPTLDVWPTWPHIYIYE